MKLPTCITQEEFEKIFNYLSNQNCPHKKEYQLCLLLGFEAGMRISEITGWKEKVPALTAERVDDVSIRIISGKGGKDRVVPRPKRMNKASLDLLPIKLKRRSIQWKFKKIALKVLGKDMHFHSLRHGFCSHLAQTRPLHEVQMLAGHSRLDTTGIYLHANPTKAIQGARDVF
jgi:integrase